MTAMIPIRGRAGTVELWLKVGRLLTLEGTSAGFIVGRAVYDYNGSQRGVFVNGVIRDHAGGVVGHIDRAPGLTIIPAIPSIPPIPPIPEIEPLRPIPEIARIPAIPQLAWSHLSLEELFDL